MKRIAFAVLAAFLVATGAQALTFNRSSFHTMLSDGVAWFADGSASAPSISFYSETDTGFFLDDTNDQVELSINGVSVGVVGSAVGALGVVPATQTIAAANTITANACGGVKNITAAGAVTTNTTNTFTAPSAANAGCVMQVCNVGANAITLDDNALFVGAGIAGATPGDTVVGADDCVPVASDGTIWRQTAPGAQG